MSVCELCKQPAYDQKCPTCDQLGPHGFRYCPQCGEFYEADLAALDNDFDERVLCPDDSCIGIIGPDGCCTECGKPKNQY